MITRSQASREVDASDPTAPAPAEGTIALAASDPTAPAAEDGDDPMLTAFKAGDQQRILQLHAAGVEMQAHHFQAVIDKMVEEGASREALFQQLLDCCHPSVRARLQAELNAKHLG